LCEKEVEKNYTVTYKERPLARDEEGS